MGHPGDLHPPIRCQAGNQLAAVALLALHDRLGGPAAFGTDAGCRHSTLHHWRCRCGRCTRSPGSTAPAPPHAPAPGCPAPPAGLRR
ncbi:hypothetical protein G6F46_014930 [Rhizopus delemar]|nr:hypothetical protein G6F46_014930 [Rhizopus delemar]